LTKVGGDFIGWANDSRSAFYSIGRSFFSYDLTLGDSLVRDSLSRADAGPPAAGGGAGGGAGAAAPPAGGGTADTTKKPSMVYEAQRYDVEIKAAKDKPRGTVVLRGARVITMKGDQVIPNGDILVTDNRIVGIGPRGSVTIPKGTKEIDVGGK